MNNHRKAERVFQTSLLRDYPRLETKLPKLPGAVQVEIDVAKSFRIFPVLWSTFLATISSKSTSKLPFQSFYIDDNIKIFEDHKSFEGNRMKYSMQFRVYAVLGHSMRILHFPCGFHLNHGIVALNFWNPADFSLRCPSCSCIHYGLLSLRPAPNPAEAGRPVSGMSRTFRKSETKFQEKGSNCILTKFTDKTAS